MTRNPRTLPARRAALRTLVLLLPAAMLAALAGCGRKGDLEPPPKEADEGEAR